MPLDIVVKGTSGGSDPPPGLVSGPRPRLSSHGSGYPGPEERLDPGFEDFLYLKWGEGVDGGFGRARETLETLHAAVDRQAEVAGKEF